MEEFSRCTFFPLHPVQQKKTRTSPPLPGVKKNSNAQDHLLGKTSCCLQFQCAGKRRFTLFMSDSFTKEHSAMAQIIGSACEDRALKWRCLALDDFRAAVRLKRRGEKCVALVTHADALAGSMHHQIACMHQWGGSWLDRKGGAHWYLHLPTLHPSLLPTVESSHHAQAMV